MTTIFKFHYYPTKGYACSQAGDNTGYYVNLNDYERLQTVNETRLEACKLALAEMQNTDAYLEAQAIAEGKHGIYNPFFVDEIRALKAAIDADPTQPVITGPTRWPGEGG